MIDANQDNSKSKMVEDDLKLKLIELIRHLRSLSSKRRDDIIKALKKPGVVVDKSTLDLFFLTIFLNGKVENNPMLQKFFNQFMSERDEAIVANKLTRKSK